MKNSLPVVPPMPPQKKVAMSERLPKGMIRQEAWERKVMQRPTQKGS